jgi:hypothetical protein
LSQHVLVLYHERHINCRPPPPPVTVCPGPLVFTDVGGSSFTCNEAYFICVKEKEKEKAC